jgi:acyl-coenzyme A synthetase/AMP-(fatty) acid ligase
VSAAAHNLGGLLLPSARAALIEAALERTTTAEELCALAERGAAALAGLGLRPGDRTLVFVPPGRTWLAAIYALFRLGAVPVALDPGLGRERLIAAIERTAPRALIGVPRAHALRLLAPRALRSVELAVTVEAPRLWSGPVWERMLAQPARDFEPAPLRAQDPAAILFTSGATGPPKGVLYTQSMFRAQLEALRRLYSFRPDEIDLACFPLFALFGPALGWTAVLPRMDFSRPARCDPEQIVAAVARYRPTNCFGSPAIWRRVAPWCHARGAKLESLERLMIAGAPVAPGLIEACQALLPRGEVHTPYGATEVLPVASATASDLLGPLRARHAAGEGNCLGRPAPGLELAILRLAEGPIARWGEELRAAPGELGEICVRSSWATREYFGDAAASALAKIPCTDGSFWHRMGDVGRVDQSGRVWFLGRKDHLLWTTRGVLPPVGVENVLRERAGLAACALVGVGARGSEKPYVIAAAPRRGRAALRGRILAAAAQHDQARAIEDVLFRPTLPVDVRHNAKIDRRELKRWAQERLR